MYVLVLFTDRTSYICEPSHISSSKDKCPSVKYTDRKKYAARILALHENYAILQKIQENLNNDVNSIHIGNLQCASEELHYSEVLQKYNTQDGAKLYLDKSILPSCITNSENYVFSLDVVEESSDFFGVQSIFIEVETSIFYDVIGEDCNPEIDLSAYHNESVEFLVKDKRELEPDKCVETLSAVHNEAIDIPTSASFEFMNTTYSVNLPVIDQSAEEINPSKEPEQGNNTRWTILNDTLINNILLDDARIENDVLFSEKNLGVSAVGFDDIHFNVETTIRDNGHDDTLKSTTENQNIDTKDEGTSREVLSRNENAESQVYDEPGDTVKSTTDNKNEATKDKRTSRKVFSKNENGESQVYDEPGDTVKSTTDNKNKDTKDKRTSRKVFSKNENAESQVSDEPGDTVKSTTDKKNEDTKEKRTSRELLSENKNVEPQPYDDPDDILKSTIENKNEEEKDERTSREVLSENKNVELEAYDEPDDIRESITENKNDETKDERTSREILLENKNAEPQVSYYLTKLISRESSAKALVKPRIIHEEILTPKALQVLKHPNTTCTLDVSIAGSSPIHGTDSLEELKKKDVSKLPPLSVLDNLVAGNIFTRQMNISDDPFFCNRSLTPPVVSSTMVEPATHITESVDAGYTEKDKDSDENIATDNSGDEYVPSAAGSSNYNGSSEEEEQSDNSAKAKKKSSNNVSKNNSMINLPEGLNKTNISAPDDIKLSVSTSATPAYTKKHFCLYCQKFQSKLARHLETVHADVHDVKKFSNLKPKNRERVEIIAMIRKAGNHLYNTDPRFNTGKLLVCRRPNKRLNKNAMHFLPCGKCKGQYARSDLRHHYKLCTKTSGKNERTVMVQGRKVSARIHEKANAAVRKHIFPYMHEDEVVRGIRYDELIVLYANKQCDKYGAHQHHYRDIRGRLRLLGRFLLAAQQINNSIQNLTDVFQPRRYNDVIAAVKIVAGFDENTRTFAHPSVASNLGTHIKHVGELLRSEYIKREEQHEQKRVEDFLKLQCEDYGTSVNRAVMETQSQNNRRKKVVLPSVDDIIKLDDFLKNERNRHLKNLQAEFSFGSWKKLAETSLVSLQVFNRRRAGEAERIYLDDFKQYRGIDKVADKDVYNSLSKEGQALARKYVRFEIRGKRGRGVPVLLNSDLLDCLLFIIDHRDAANVPKDNPYLFGLPSYDKDRFRHLYACDLIRKYSAECGASVPSTLRGTKLRKHIATRCLQLNVSENRVSQLADYMGHDEKIHKNIYRQPVPERDIVKVSKLLEIAQGGGGESSNDDDSESEENEENDSIKKTRKSISENETSSLENIKEAEMSGKRVSISNRKKRRVHETTNRKSVSVHRERSTHKRWSEEERATVLTAFKTILIRGDMPTGKTIQKLINDNVVLKGRTIPQIRTWLHGKKKEISEGD